MNSWRRFGGTTFLHVCSRGNEYLYFFLVCCMVSIQGQGSSKATGQKQDEKGVCAASLVDQEKNDPEQKLVDVEGLSLDEKK